MISYFNNLKCSLIQVLLGTCIRSIASLWLISSQPLVASGIMGTLWLKSRSPDTVAVIDHDIFVL